MDFSLPDSDCWHSNKFQNNIIATYSGKRSIEAEQTTKQIHKAKKPCTSFVAENDSNCKPQKKKSKKNKLKRNSDQKSKLAHSKINEDLHIEHQIQAEQMRGEKHKTTKSPATFVAENDSNCKSKRKKLKKKKTKENSNQNTETAHKSNIEDLHINSQIEAEQTREQLTKTKKAHTSFVVKNVPNCKLKKKLKKINPKKDSDHKPKIAHTNNNEDFPIDSNLIKEKKTLNKTKKRKRLNLKEDERLISNASTSKLKACSKKIKNKMNNSYANKVTDPISSEESDNFSINNSDDEADKMSGSDVDEEENENLSDATVSSKESNFSINESDDEDNENSELEYASDSSVGSNAEFVGDDDDDDDEEDDEEDEILRNELRNSEEYKELKHFLGGGKKEKPNPVFEQKAEAHSLSKKKQAFSDDNKNCDTNVSNDISYTNVINISSGTLKSKAAQSLQGARFRILNEKFYNTSGRDAQIYFQSNIEDFKDYHEGFRGQVQKWPVNPVDIIIKDLHKINTNDIIADMGCGEAKIAQTFPKRKIHSFDLLPLNKHVTCCEFSRVKLPNESVHVVIFCLSLMGTNLRQYLCEAYRILKTGGTLKIAEIESRVEDLEDFIKNIEFLGFQLIKQNVKHNFFVFLDFSKEKIRQKKKRIAVIKLKPCMYKKR